MQIPFLKKKNQQGGGSSPIEVTRESDSMSPDSLKESVAEELMSGIHKKDFKTIKDAMRALVSMLKEE